MMTEGGPAGRFAGGCAADGGAAGLLASSATAIEAANANTATEKDRYDRFGFMPPIVGRSCEWQKAWSRRSRIPLDAPRQSGTLIIGPIGVHRPIIGP